MTEGVPRSAIRRDAARTRRAILDAALEVFSESGYAGARIDTVALRAGVSKPMIYSYFGDKDALYAAALREAYVQIRSGERDLKLEALDPEAALRALIRFTLQHFRSKPWFISMLNTENLMGGTTVRKIRDAGEIQSLLVARLREILERGTADGLFRPGLNPVDLYVSIAALCYFPISNRHTLRAVFGCPVDEAWLERHSEVVEEMVLGYLSPSKPHAGANV